MKRKLIKQGGGGLTFYVPKKWTDLHGLNAGDEIDVDIEESQLIVNIGSVNKPVKSTQIEVDSDNFNVHRSTLGGLYRAGYDEVKVIFKDPRVLSLLQKVTDSLYGFEVLDIKPNSCIIKSVYQVEPSDILPHVLKMIYIIRTMHAIIIEDIKAKKYNQKKASSNTANSKETLFQLRNDALKQRDLVVRVLVQRKLLDEHNFSFHTIVLGLWNVARNYYLLYDNIEPTKKYTAKNIQFLSQTCSFFDSSFARLSGTSVNARYTNYEKLRKEGLNLMKNKAEASIIVSFCINILMAIQSTDSSLLVVNQRKENIEH